MCFDGFFRYLKEMSIAQNLYINVSMVLFTITLVLAGLITLINFLTNNFTYKDMINIVDNMEFWEIDMYLQASEISMIDLVNDYGITYSLFSMLENFYARTGNNFLLREDIFDNYIKEVLIFDDGTAIPPHKFSSFKNSNKVLLDKIDIKNISSIVYSRYEWPNVVNKDLTRDQIETNFNRAKIIMKHSFLYLNLLRKIKFLSLDFQAMSKESRFVDRIFFNIRNANAYFYITGADEKFSFDPEKYKDQIAEKYVEMVRKTYNTRLFCRQNDGNYLKNLANNPLFLDRDEQVSNFLSSPNANLNNKPAYKPEFSMLFNTFNNQSSIGLDSDFIADLVKNTDPADFNEKLSSDGNFTKKIKDFFLTSKTNFFMFSNMDFFDEMANQIFSLSDYRVLPIFARADGNKELKNKKHCYLLRKYLTLGMDKKFNISDLNTLRDCFLDNSDPLILNTDFWDIYMDNSLDLLNLNSSTYFDFCNGEYVADDEDNYYEYNDFFTMVPRKFCLNRFSIKKRLEGSSDINIRTKRPIRTSGKVFKFKNSIMPLLSYYTDRINYTISNFYLSVFLKNEGGYKTFENKLLNQTHQNMVRGLYYFVSFSIILVFYFIYNIMKVKDFIDQPLKKIESTLSNISDKVKFKDSKKYLDKYLLEDDSKTINEFKYLIKMILKLVEGNLILKKSHLKTNDLDLIHSHNEIQPINMVKFNRYIVFENKILETIDKNQYCLELTEKSEAEMAKDERLKNSAIFTNIIQKKFLQEKNNRINQDAVDISARYAEENFKTKYETLAFEEFKSDKFKYGIDDVFNADWMKVDEILDGFHLEVNEKYMEDWYKDDQQSEVLYNLYDEIFDS